MTLRAFVIALLALLATTHLAAQPATEAPAAEPLTLAEVLRSVERHLPTLEAARRERDVADADLLSAEGGFDPALRARGGVSAGYYDYARAEVSVEQPTPLWGATVFAGWRLGRGFGSSSSSRYQGIPDYYGNLATYDLGELRAGVTVPLWRNGPIDRRRASIRRAELARPAAALGVTQERLAARRAATEAYWAWVAAGRRLAIAEGLLALALDREAAVTARAERGDLPRIETVDNARAVLQRRGMVVAATRGLEQAAIALSIYLRDARGESVVPSASRLPTSWPEPEAGEVDVARAVREAVERRPEPRRLELQAAQLRVEREWARNQLAPAIDLTLAASQDLGAATPGLSAGQGRPAGEVWLTLEIPILNRVARGRVAAAEAGAARLAAQARFARDRVAAEVRDARSALSAARQRVEIAGQEVGAAVALEAAERARFDAGDSTLLIVNLREQAAAEARLREVDARLDQRRAAAAWTAVTATLDDELDRGAP